MLIDTGHFLANLGICLVNFPSFQPSVYSYGSNALCLGMSTGSRALVVEISHPLPPMSFCILEEGCGYEDCPLPLLPGESVEYMCSLAGGGGLLYLTNYRLIATQKSGFYSVSWNVHVQYHTVATPTSC